MHHVSGVAAVVVWVGTPIGLLRCSEERLHLSPVQLPPRLYHVQIGPIIQQALYLRFPSQRLDSSQVECQEP